MDAWLRLAPLLLLSVGVVTVVWRGLSHRDAADLNRDTHGTAGEGD